MSWPSITAPNSPVEARGRPQGGPWGLHFLWLDGRGWVRGDVCVCVCVREQGDSPSPRVFPRATLCRSTITSRSFSFSSSLMPRLFTAWGGGRQSHGAGLAFRQHSPGRVSPTVNTLHYFYGGSKRATSLRSATTTILAPPLDSLDLPPKQQIRVKYWHKFLFQWAP